MAQDELIQYLERSLTTRFGFVSLDKSASLARDKLTLDQTSRLAANLGGTEWWKSNGEYTWLAFAIEALPTYLDMMFLGIDAGKDSAANINDTRELFTRYGVDYSSDAVKEIIPELQTSLNKKLNKGVLEVDEGFGAGEVLRED